MDMHSNGSNYWGKSGRSDFLFPFFIFLSLLILTRHAQLPFLNSLLVPLTVLTTIVSIRVARLSLVVIAPLVLYCLLSLIISVAAGRDLIDSLRFFLIIFMTIISFLSKSKISNPGLILSPILFQCMLVSFISVFLAYADDAILSRYIREIAINGDWGDIYTFDGFYHRVQLVGNALIPLLFFISIYPTKNLRLHKSLFFLSICGLISAGNLTYFITASFAIFLKLGKIIQKEILYFITIILILSSVFLADDFYKGIIEFKFNGADSSMGVRIDQINSLSEKFSDSPFIAFFGSGLGERFPDGNVRNYSEGVYIELQSLYILYQIGIFGFTLYMLTLVYLIKNNLNPVGRKIFWFYIISGLTNPYIFDVNQILATLILVNLYPSSSVSTN